VASKISGAKASGMFRSMMPSSSSFSGSNIASAFTHNLSPTKTSIQDGSIIEADDQDEEALEAALLEAAYEGDRPKKEQPGVEDTERTLANMKTTSLVEKCQSST
jgi:hypothetical protein